MGLLLYKSHHSETGRWAVALAHEENLKELGLFSMENSQFGGNKAEALRHLRGRDWEDGARLFMVGGRQQV